MSSLIVYMGLFALLLVQVGITAVFVQWAWNYSRESLAPKLIARLSYFAAVAITLAVCLMGVAAEMFGRVARALML